MINPDLMKFLYLISAGIMGLLFKIFYDSLKKKNGGPQGETVFQIGEIHEVTKVLEKGLSKIDADLEGGLEIAKQNSASHQKFILALNDLKNMVGNSIKVHDELMQETKKQTGILVEIKKNGRG